MGTLKISILVQGQGEIKIFTAGMQLILQG